MNYISVKPFFFQVLIVSRVFSICRKTRLAEMMRRYHGLRKDDEKGNIMIYLHQGKKRWL